MSESWTLACQQPQIPQLYTKYEHIWDHYVRIHIFVFGSWCKQARYYLFSPTVRRKGPCPSCRLFVLQRSPRQLKASLRFNLVSNLLLDHFSCLCILRRRHIQSPRRYRVRRSCTTGFHCQLVQLWFWCPFQLGSLLQASEPPLPLSGPSSNLESTTCTFNWANQQLVVSSYFSNKRS